jgi:hypothetical protein
MIVISPENNIGSDTEFTLRGKSFTHIMNKRVPRIDTLENSCFNLPQAEKKKLSCIG